MSKILSDPVGRLVDLAKKTDRRRLVGLSGVPGSGKSTVVRAWQAALQGKIVPESAVLLGMDGFHLTRAELRTLPNPEEALARRGAPWTFKPRIMAERLRLLREAFGRVDVLWPGFDHGVGDPIEDAHRIPSSTAVVVVEGIYTAYDAGDWNEVSSQFDEHWYLDVSWIDAKPWLVSRHMKSSDMTYEAAVARAESNDRLNAQFVEPGKSSADWLIPQIPVGDDRTTGVEPSRMNSYYIDHIKLVADSLHHWTGRSLVRGGIIDAEMAREIFEAPFALVSHGVESDPIFNYGNQTALELFELVWSEFIKLPSRYSAEPVEREARKQLMERVSTHGYVDDYSGVRVAGTGRRFYIRRATVWNLVDGNGVYRGQAALFDAWEHL